MSLPGEDPLPRGVAAVVGPGRVGTVLALALARDGHRVRVAGGSAAARERIASLVAGTRRYEEPAEAVRDADLVVLTVPDAVIGEVATSLAVADVLRESTRVVHTAGSQGLAPLRRAALAGAGVAACHPAQTFPTGGTDPDVLVGTPWAVTAAEADRPWAHAFVTALGGEPHDLEDHHRVLYHAGLTVGSNAVAAAVSVARRLLTVAGIEQPRRFLDDLVTRSAGNVLDDGAAAITGPVVRGDAGTVRAHLGAMRDAPELAAAYRLLTEVIVSQVAVGEHGQDLREAIMRALEEDDDGQ